MNYIHREAILTSFFILLNFLILSAQNKEELRGRIKIDNFSNIAINIVNLNTKKWTISQPNGKFRIPAKEGDTVLFTSLQHQPKKIFITNKILSEDSIEVFLNIQVYELSEVFLKNRLSRNLSQVIKNLSYFNQAEVGFPLNHKDLTVGERRLKAAQSGVLDPLLNALSGRTKILKRQVKHERDNEELKDLKKALPVDYISSHLHIPEDSFNEFLYFCIEDKDIKAALRRNNYLEIMKLSEKKARIFLNRISY